MIKNEQNLQENSDLKYMKMAYIMAQEGEKKGEVPIGAVLVNHETGEVLAQTHNLKETHHTPLGHAELMALHKGSRKLKRWRLQDCTLYVTLEPCAMCAGALIQARVARVVYACHDPKAGACHSLFQIGQDQRLNHRFEISSGLLQNECAQLLKHFFQRKRVKG